MVRTRRVMTFAENADSEHAKARKQQRGDRVCEVTRGQVSKTTPLVLDLTFEDAYWSEHYASRYYYDRAISFDDYRLAYRYGSEARANHVRCSFEAVEAELRENWNSARASCQLDWEKAREAIRDAWDRVDRKLSRKVRA